MKAIRAFLALTLAAAAIAMIVKVAIPRLECNLAKGRVNREMKRLAQMGDEYDRLSRARKNVATCRACMAMFPYDHHWHLLLAANLRILDERDEAILSFQRALALTERPEIYAQLAQLEIERGNISEGRAALLRAATFQIFYIDYVADPLRGEIQTAVMARYERLRAKARQ